MARLGIHGHTSLETAHMVDDYPYGQLRCKRRTWLEFTAKRGFRFVAQTENPKNGRWNAPKKSTYIEVAACMYLDDKGHVAWTGVGVYTEAQQALNFAQDFGPRCEGAADLRAWADRKAKLANAWVTGQARVRVNGVEQERTEADKARDIRDAELWTEVSKLLSEG